MSEDTYERNQTIKLQQCLLKHKEFLYELPSLSLEPEFAAYPGQLKVERVLQGKNNAFHIPGEEQKKEKKTVVLSDWSLQYMPDEQFKKACTTLIKGLFFAGFDVRFWDGKKATKTDVNEIEKQLESIRACKDDVIKQKLSAENIVGDAILHLDYFKLRKIFLI